MNEILWQSVRGRHSRLPTTKALLPLGETR
jgi:hypothetical protein